MNLKSLSVEDMLAQFRQMRQGVVNAPAGESAKVTSEEPVVAPAVRPVTRPSAIETEAPPVLDTAVMRVPLNRIVVHLRQPRRVLPDDLRQAFARGERDAAATIDALITRAASGDSEAQGHLGSLRALADSIARLGVEHPLQLMPVPERADGRYEIKDGERRFWACVLLAGQGDRLQSVVPALIDGFDDGAAAPSAAAFGATLDPVDRLQLAQWEVNTQREPIPEVDIACFVRDTYRAQYDQVRLDRVGALARLAATAPAAERASDTLSDGDLAIALTVQVVHARTGRRLGPRSVYRLTRSAERLSDTAVRLARAHRLSQRDLSALARIAPDAQTERALQLAQRAQQGGEPPATAAPASGRRRRHRPTLAERETRLCQRLTEHVTQRNPTQLARLSEADLRALLAQVGDAREALDEYAELLNTVLRRARPAEAAT